MMTRAPLVTANKRAS
uniref:Uncharacterized protein n=1 Tax=Panagrellus redivivus TaxID=6233 RepID=A0A7E4VVS9_PANRE